jgi:protein-arginine kinase activator protein McsA
MSLRNATAEVLRCPECGSAFSLLYARTIACAGCPHTFTECVNVRCPRCDVEFPI